MRKGYNRTPNTKCDNCATEIYIRPCQLKEKVYYISCGSKCSSLLRKQFSRKYPKIRKSPPPFTKIHLDKISKANKVANKKLWENPEYRQRMLNAGGLFKKGQDMLKGKDHYNWKGGVTSANKLERYKFYNTMRVEVLKRDNYTCQMCNSRENLQVDHIQSWSEYIELRFNMDNCRTLCVECHYKITYGKPIPADLKHWGQNIEREAS